MILRRIGAVLLGLIIAIVIVQIVEFGRSAIPAYIVGAILLCGGIGSALLIPQQTWFSAASFVGYIVATLIGVRLAAPRPAYPQAPRPA